MNETKPKFERNQVSKRESRVDIGTIVLIGAAALLLLVVFGWALFSSGLLMFSINESGGVDASGDYHASAYYIEALQLRERRYNLALLYRTFITGFSFVVGLCICTYGGLFILRQVEVYTGITFSPDGTGENMSENEASTGLEEELPKQKKLPNFGAPKARFATYSPGVVFLLGGVAIMISSQYLAIKVRVFEAFPPGAFTVVSEESEELFQPIIAPEKTENYSINPPWEAPES